MTHPDHIAAPRGEVFWRYEEPPSRGSTVLLLTLGRITVRGPWTGRLGEFYIAWAPLPKRDKAREAQLINEGVIPA